MAWGFFKKVVIADRLAVAVDYIFGQYGSLSWQSLAIGAVFYSFQIYCDFSGYSDIAVGAAKVMNIDLMQNFDRPYGAASIREFWSRWHISLSTWFRDYLYIPLGGNRNGTARQFCNLLFVFLISGLWHGASWTFIAWGAVHGLMVGAEMIPNNLPGRKWKFPRPLRIFLTFLLVTLAWILFRAPDLPTAYHYTGRMLRLVPGETAFGMQVSEMLFSLLLIAILLIKEKYYPSFLFPRRRTYLLYLGTVITACYFFGVFGENQFIYFQF